MYLDFRAAAAKYAGTEIYDLPCYSHLEAATSTAAPESQWVFTPASFGRAKREVGRPKYFLPFLFPFLYLAGGPKYRQISFIKFSRSNALEETCLPCGLGSRWRFSREYTSKAIGASGFPRKSHVHVFAHNC